MATTFPSAVPVPQRQVTVVPVRMLIRVPYPG
jgi:hypothetical protein